MSEYWSVERWRIISVLFALSAIWLTTDNLLIAILLPCSIYFGWHSYQLYCLERWLRNGLKAKEAPDADGIWGIIVQHIYRQKQLQKKHKKKFKSLLHQFNLVVSALPEAAVVLNQHKEIEWSNKAAKKLLGIEHSRDIGQHIGNLIRVPELQHSLDSNRDVSLELLSPVSTSIHIALRLISFENSRYLLTACDISQQINIQQIREAFIANASHELRTPLTVISGYLEIMEANAEIPDNLHEPIVSAKLQANRMERIIDDLLTLSRLETSNLSKNSGTVIDVSNILTNIIKDIQKTLAMDSHILNLDIDSAIKIKAVENEVNSICLNLIKNAVIHTPANTKIQVKWFLKDTGQACLQVIDNGEGIPTKDIPHLTERFYRVNHSRSGTGLGLAIVKHIMERHQGYILINSQPLLETKFTVCFPVYRVIK